MRRLDMESDLRHAIEDDELEVFYQPIVQAATGRIVGFEALCRWPGADGNSIEPAEFVPIADETGLIVPLGRRVLEVACRELAEWRELPGGAGLTIGVNVSHRQLSEPSFAAELARGAGEHRAGPARAAPGGPRERPRARAGGRRGARSPTCWRRSACAGRSTTSARAPRRCTCCTASRATRSRSSGRW